VSARQNELMASDIQHTIDAVWRMEAAKIVATLTRAVGDVGMAEDLDGLADSYLLPSVRGELLCRLGRNAEAAGEFARAANMATNDRERDVLLDKAERVRA
jgi:predicted RNA polymerase sigma factor